MGRVLVLAIASALVVTGCGGDSRAEVTNVKVYFLRGDKVWPVAREISANNDIEALADALVNGPTDQERAELGLESALPASTIFMGGQVSDDAVATVTFADATSLSFAAGAQIVYTMTAIPSVDSVDLFGVDPYTRADFEQHTPSVLIESPLPFEEVDTPLRVTGTANTFEANFQYELLDSAGNVVDENFVTATSGTGTRGTFEFTTADFDDVAALVVFESSAEDGSRIHEVEIPLDPAP
jgi:hypothetical protein